MIVSLDSINHPRVDSHIPLRMSRKISIKTSIFACFLKTRSITSPSARTKPHMFRTLSLLCVAALVAGVSTLSAQSVTTDPVGFITLTVFGPAVTGDTANTFIGLGFTQPVSYQAALASAAATTLTDSSAAFTVDQFSGPAGSFYLELTNGTGAGRTSQITGTPTATTITTADNLSSFVTAGATYKIRKNWTLSSVFGPNAESGIAGGNITTADQVLVYSTAGQAYLTFYYKTSGIGGTGWRSTASTSINEATHPFMPTDGLLVLRHTAGNVTFALAGAVKLGPTALPVVPGSNLLSNVYPAGTFTLNSSNLVGSGLTGGNLTTADQVLIFNNTSNAFDTYYFKTSGIGGTGWRSTASTSTPEDNHGIPFGASVFIQRINPGSFTWVAPQPF